MTNQLNPFAQLKNTFYLKTNRNVLEEKARITWVFLKKKFNLFIFGCAASSLLRRRFSSCSKRGLLSSGGARTYCGSFSVVGHRL